jgi:two-component system response regulator
MKHQELDLLIVEDNASDAELMIRTLKKNQVFNKIILTKDGEEALNYVFGKGKYANRDTNNFPGVIFLDIKLPKVDGLEVLRQLKENEQTKKIPVIIVSSSKEDPDIKSAYNLGANSYVVKPVGFNEFKHKIDQLGLYWLVVNEKPK